MSMMIRKFLVNYIKISNIMLFRRTFFDIMHVRSMIIPKRTPVQIGQGFIEGHQPARYSGSVSVPPLPIYAA